MSEQILWFSPTDFVTGDPTLISYPLVGHPSTIVTCKKPGELKRISMGLATTTSYLRYLRSIAALAFLAVALAGPAQAETVTATLRFRDGDNDLVPIIHAKVEVWRFRGPGIWGWNNDRTVYTNSQGYMSTVMPFVEPGVVYGLRVFATNAAAEVYTQDIYTAPFYRELGRPGPEIHRTAMASSDVLDFSYDFDDILIGAVGFQKNEIDLIAGTQQGKIDPACYIREKARLSNLKDSTGVGSKRFKIWNFKLRR